MDGPPLDPQEMEAIREAMRDSSNQPRRASADVDVDDVAPLSIIADDRAAVTARPSARRLAERWQQQLDRAFRHLLAEAPELQVVACDSVDGPSLRDELDTMWTLAIAPRGRRGQALVAVSGPLVENLVAHSLGAEDTHSAPNRKPSITALRLFGPIGEVFVATLARAWQHEQDCEIHAVADDRAPAVHRSIFAAEMLIAITLSVAGAVEGRVLCLARPETLVPPPPAIQAVPAPAGAIEEALGAVPVLIRVDLGRARLTRRELARLEAGAVIELGQFLDASLPIECAGVVKAHGRAVVHRGVLSVEVASLAESRSQAA